MRLLVTPTILYCLCIALMTRKAVTVDANSSETKASHREVRELQGMMVCPDATTAFDTSMSIRLAGDPDQITESTIETLGSLLSDSYNRGNLCDPSHRTITAVMVPFWRSSSNQDEIILEFQIQGLYCKECHGSELESLFEPSATPIRERYLLNDPEETEEDDGTLGRKTEEKKRGNFKNRHQEHRQAQLIVDLDDVDPCACPAANPQTFSSEAGFQSFYAAELSRAKANGAIEGIDGVNGVSEVVMIPCANTFKNFSTTVFLELSGEPNDVQVEEVLVLQDAYGNSYNDLQGEFCDDLERRITNTKFELASVRRMLQPGFGGGGKFFKFINYRATVNGTCRFCPSSTLLFGNDAGRRQLQGSDEASSFDVRGRGLQPSGVSGSCTCTSASLEKGIRAPSQSEFLSEYNDTVTELAEQGVLTNVGSVGGVVEAEEVVCPSELSEFESVVFVQLTGDPEAVALREVEALENGFSETYNDLQGDYCDDLFRSITSTTFDLAAARRLEATERELQFGRFVSFIYIGKTNGTCAFCPRSTNLFGNDAGRRHLELASPSGFSSRVLQADFNGASCFCSTGSEDDAPPEAAFVSAYSDTVTDLVESGVLLNVDGVDGVAEVEEVSCTGVIEAFSSLFFIELSADPDAVTDQELDILGVAFGETYNGLQTGYCDPLKRLVDKATFELRSHRRLEPSTMNKEYLNFGRRLDQVAANYAVNVTGMYLKDSSVPDGFQPPLTSSQGNTKGSGRAFTLINTRHDFRRNLQGSACHCTPSSIENGLSAPREDDLIASYNITVVELAENGDLSTVGGVVGATEVIPLSCDGEITSFSSLVYMELTADPTAVTLKELEILGLTFGDTYNSLQSEYCDPLRRTIESAVFETRRLDVSSSFGAHQSQRTQQVATNYAVNITGKYLKVSKPGTEDPPLTSSNLGTQRGRRMQRRHTRNFQSRSLQTPCGELSYCAVGAANNGQSAPREKDLVDRYRENVVKLANEGVLENVTEVIGATEVDIVTCSGVITSFSALLFMELSADPDAVEPSELDVLGVAFGDTYNVLQGEYCDPLQRTIDNATFTLQSARRLLAADDDYIRDGRRLMQVTSNYAVNVKGMYRKNEDDSTDSDEPLLTKPGSTKRANGGRRLLDREAIRSWPFHRSLNTTGDGSCICSVANVDNGLHAPREDDLVDRYNETVIKLAEEGVLENVTGVVGATEVDIVNCSGVVTSFSALLFMELSADPDAVEPNELDILGVAFGDTYNVLQGEYCDPLQRTVDNATFTLQSARRLIAIDEVYSRDGRRMKKVASNYAVNVNGQFLKGGSEESLNPKFTTSGSRERRNRSRRLLDEEKAGSRKHHRSQTSDGECICSTVNVENGLTAPREDDLVESFNVTIVELATKGELQNVAGIFSLLELQGTRSPSMSLSPSEVPSDSPSMKPSRLPSKSPSSMPSMMPSEYPSMEPSVSVPPSPSPSSSIELCEVDISMVTSELQIELIGDVASIDPDVLAAAFEEAFNSLRTSRCENHAGGVEVKEVSSRRLSEIFPEWRKLDILNTTATTLVTVDLQWACSENCTAVNALNGKDPSALVKRISEEIQMRAPDSGTVANDLNIKTNVPSTSPSLVPSMLPSLPPSQPPATSTTPSNYPSLQPSIVGSRSPSVLPSLKPSAIPSEQAPSAVPSERALCVESEVDELIDFQDFEDTRWTGWTNGKVDQSDPRFSMILGRFHKNDDFPYKTFYIPALGINRVYMSFYFYEIDGWDGDSVYNGGVDTFSMTISGDLEDDINFGHFHRDHSEPSESGMTPNGIKWARTAETIENSPQGFLSQWKDQRHFIHVEIPAPTWIRISEQLTVTLKWALVGETDESVGIDDVKVISCRDITPSSTPSTTPTSTPSVEPTSTPSVQPSSMPSVQPSSMPSLQPSSMPSSVPSSNPSSEPSQQPSSMPSLAPSLAPTSVPSLAPSSAPTSVPSSAPSVDCDIAGFTFYSGLNTIGHTLFDGTVSDGEESDGISLPSLTDAGFACGVRDDCVAFTTNGELRYGLDAEVNWGQAISRAPYARLKDGCGGTWVKTSKVADCYPNGCNNIGCFFGSNYRFYYKKDSPFDGNVGLLPDHHSNGLQGWGTLCDNTPGCVAFNSDKKMKHTVSERTAWDLDFVATAGEAADAGCPGLWVNSACRNQHFLTACPNPP